jgi:hypothetical protein
MKVLVRSGNRSESYPIDSVNTVYKTAEKHRGNCKEGDSMYLMKDDKRSVGIKFYSRGKTRVFSITKYVN